MVLISKTTKKLYNKKIVSMMIIIMSFVGSLIITITLKELFLFTPILAFADHGQEISLRLNSAEFAPLSTNKSAHQVRVLVNYTVSDSSLSNNTINSVMKVYSLNGTLLKTSSSPDGFTIINNTGIQRHASTLTNSTIQNVIAVVQFTDASKTIPLSNPVQVKLNLTQPTTTTTTQEEQENKQEIAALPS
jgi:hypothetical protein